MDQSEPIGSLLQRTRERLGYSQYELAEHLAEVSGHRSVTRGDVARWERGKRIPSRFWKPWLSRVLSVPVEQLHESARVTRRMRFSA